jgi:hypothetical protein
MAEEKERIELIRSRRGSRDSVQLSGRGDQGGTTGVQDLEPHLLANIQHPWQARDSVRLSLDAQIAMIQQRANYRANMVDTGYTNRISHVQVRNGVHCIAVSYGYMRVYNLR